MYLKTSPSEGSNLLHIQPAVEPSLWMNQSPAQCNALKFLASLIGCATSLFTRMAMGAKKGPECCVALAKESTSALFSNPCHTQAL